MNKVLAILLFPFLWIACYLYRIIWYDIIQAIFKIIYLFFVKISSGLFLLIVSPFSMLIDIPVGLVATFVGTLGLCADIFQGYIDLESAVIELFSKNN